MGFLEEVWEPGEPDLSVELGAASLQPKSVAEARTRWQKEQEEWLAAAKGNLCQGGTVTIMLGNGDALEENANEIDCLQSTLAAASAVGFDVARPSEVFLLLGRCCMPVSPQVATSTIESCADAAHESKGMLRTEHMIHLRKPS